jgi:hypothetical protein
VTPERRAFSGWTGAAEARAGRQAQVAAAKRLTAGGHDVEVEEASCWLTFFEVNRPALYLYGVGGRRKEKMIFRARGPLA